jgi:Nidogen-like/PEP-CTERM motif
MKTRFSMWCATALLALAALPGIASAAAPIRSFAGSAANTLPPNDDGSTGLVGMGFTGNFFGVDQTQLYVNNNGNVTFASPLSIFTPFNLNTPTGNPIIAAFFGDVDTRGPGDPVTYGAGILDGHNAFAVNYLNVGVYSVQPIFNTFQLLLIERADTGLGNFDFEFNYSIINWEAGTASQAPPGGLGGVSAYVGYNSGTGTSFQLAGSGVNGAFIDSNLTSGLIHNQLGTPYDGANMNGRYDFQVRNGIVQQATPVPEPSTYGIFAGLGLVGLAVVRRKQRR